MPNYDDAAITWDDPDVTYDGGGTVTPPSTPPDSDFPIVDPFGVPPTLPDDTTSLAYRLFRHYKSRPEGINVYIMSDGSVTQSDPDGSSSLWRESDRMGDTIPGAPHVTHVFWGGHDMDAVTPAEAIILANAGYTV